MQRTTLARWLAALALVATPAMAQKIPVEDFAKYADIDEVELSPTGEYLALAIPKPDGKETNLQIVRLSDNTTIKTLRFGQEQHVSGVTWTGDETITVSRAKRFPMEEFASSLGQLMSTNLTGDKQRLLFAYLEDNGTQRGRKKDLGWAFLERVLDNEPNKALVRFVCFPSDCGEDGDTVVFKVDTLTGERKEVERIRDGEVSSHFIYDRNGIARVAYSSLDDGTPKMSYRPTPTSAWTPLPKSIAAYSVEGGVFAQDNNTLYARVADKREPTQLYKIDITAGTREKILGRDDVEVGAILTGGHADLPFGITYRAFKPSVQYFDNTSPWAQLHAGLLKKFPGKMINFVSFSRDDNKVLFAAWSDRQPWDYFLLDRANGNKIVQVGSRYPWMDGKPFVAMKPIEFKSRDGKTLQGFFTAPAGPGPHPLVVMPHGGPFEVNDEWGFDGDVQFLANRGYAVLQVNYRGSSGRGDDFVSDGYLGWGTTIQDDITDGVKHVIAQNLVDKDRICMYGASFGGYSAMMQPIRNPGMYKCAIGYVGVYDLPLLARTEKSDLNSVGEAWLARSMGTDKAKLTEQSPALRAREIDVPVMLVHGKADDTAGMNQYRAMEKALEDIGKKPEIFVAPGEGHGFTNPANRAELYRRMEAFLDKYIGPNAKVATSP
jgi:dipeptidyl aminopeptidase/acylaminoacyl peptidase